MDSENACRSPRAVCSEFHPDARMLLAYIPCWPFEAEICEQCESVQVYWGFWKTLLWDALIGPWWSGSMKVYEHIEFPGERRRNEPEP